MDRWDVLIIIGAGYVAVTALVRLMAVRRNRLIEQVRQQMQQQHKQQAAKKPAGEDADRGAA